MDPPDQGLLDPDRSTQVSLTGRKYFSQPPEGE